MNEHNVKLSINSLLTCIVVLNWNGLEKTMHCLKSLLKMKNCKYQLIVVDNGSINNEAKILKDHFGVNIDIIRSDTNLGFSGGVNLGIKKSFKYNPDFFLLLNNDVIVTENFLSHLILKAMSGKDIGLVSPVIYDMKNKKKIIFSGGGINWFFARPYHKTATTSEFDQEEFITGCSMLINKAVIQKIGLFDERFFAYFEDAAYSLLATRANFKCVCARNAIIYHDVSSSLGTKSRTYVYLFSRNRILFVNNYTNTFYKFYFAIFNAIKLVGVFLYYIVNKRKDLAFAYTKGYIHGIKNITGAPRL